MALCLAMAVHQHYEANRLRVVQPEVIMMIEIRRDRANKLADLSFEIDELYAQGAITAEQAGSASLTISKLQRGWRDTLPDMIEKLLSI